ncbi:saccharopine dehydrogenase [Streptomyces sp. NPDC048111]|uniref:saccharopine dehydrogenase n=1 Tax=Streptomyces sp. NPDC048111 TaxID=3365500 RepID=UPI003720D57C
MPEPGPAGGGPTIDSGARSATSGATVSQKAGLSSDWGLQLDIPYLDVAGEIEAGIDTFAHFGGRARDAGAVIVPAMAYFGGIGDLLVTAAMGDWTEAEEADIACALSSWHPTAGTRAAGAVSRRRRGGRHLVHTEGRLEHRADAATTLVWSFPDPIGPRPVTGEFTTIDVVTVSSHLSIAEVRTHMTVEAVRDTASPDTPGPTAVDARGRSDQTFLVDAVVRSGGTERHAVARGQDIYSATAPLVVEAAERILDGRSTGCGVVAAGEIFDAADFLHALAPDITVELCP